MSKPEYTRFRLNLPQFSIEISGEKTFVEELYRKVQADLLPLLENPGKAAQIHAQSSSPSVASMAQSGGRGGPPAIDESNVPRMDYTWIYSCTTHYNKVYVVENRVINHSIFGRYIDARRVRRIYIDRDKTRLFKELSSGTNTLWAEITPEGRKMIEQAASRRKG